MTTAVLKKTDHSTAFGYVRMACRRVIARSASVAACKLLAKSPSRSHLTAQSRTDGRYGTQNSLTMKVSWRDALLYGCLATCLRLAAEIHELRIRLDQLLDYIVIQLDSLVWPDVRRREVSIGGHHTARRGERSHE